MLAQNALPPAKEAIEQQYSQERAAGAQNPAPRNPNAPFPIVPPRPFETGIFDDCDSFHGALIVNCWRGILNGVETSVFAGVEPADVDSQQGIVVLTPSGDFVPTPVRAGAARIVAARNGLLTLVTATGNYVLTFDVSTRTFTSVVVDNTPPVIKGMPAAGCTLWPPNHKLVQVATVTATDDTGVSPGTFKVTATSNQPIASTDPTNPDIVITPNGSGRYIVQLRAERLGNVATSRIYTLKATATDFVGTVASTTATCTVPHDQGK